MAMRNFNDIDKVLELLVTIEKTTGISMDFQRGYYSYMYKLVNLDEASEAFKSGYFMRENELRNQISNMKIDPLEADTDLVEDLSNFPLR